MRAIVRRIVGVVVVIHGLVHLLGVVEGFGWADVDRLTEPIGTAGAIGWLAAAGSTVTAGVLLVVGARWWWIVGGLAAPLSQAMILSAWSDAKAGTIANVVLVLAVAHGAAAEGPSGLRSRYRRLAAAAAEGLDLTATAVVSESDLAHLPEPVAAYVRASGALGLPHVRGFRAEIHGRIRRGPDDAWMPWTGAQVNTYGDQPSRVYVMDATMRGLPADVLHVYRGSHATMRVKAASIVPIVDASGPEMDRAETVTLLNDLCVLAPAALVDAPVEWVAIDGRHARATFTNAGHTVSAELVFDDDHRLVDFVSDDRARASTDGRTFEPTRWSTPLDGYRSVGGRRVATEGRGRWHPTDGPSYDYVDFHVDDVAYFEAGPVADGGGS